MEGGLSWGETEFEEAIYLFNEAEVDTKDIREGKLIDVFTVEA